MNPLHAQLPAVLSGLEGWCTAEKAAHLADLILAAKPRLAVEIGVFGGRSLIPIAMALRACGSGGIAYGIDSWSAEAALEGEEDQANRDWWSHNVKLEDIYRGFVAKVLALNLTQECRWVRARSEAVAGMFPDGSIDFFHLDSNHSALVSCRDVDLWKGKLAKDAHWILDDSDWPSQARAVEKIKAAGFALISDAGKYMVFRRVA